MRKFALLSPLLLLLSGCHFPQSIFDTHGPAAERIVHLSWFMTISFLVITFIMWALIGWAAIHRRGSLEEHAPIETNDGQAWIAIGGLAIPLVFLCVIFVWGLQLLAGFPIHNAMNRKVMKPDILIIGHQFWWEVHYLDGPPDHQFVTANEIHIPVGKAVLMQLNSEDVIHSFWVPALHGKVDLIPGHPNFMEIAASHAGSYTGECAVFCGEQHAHMRLLVIAQTPQNYEAWYERQLQPAQEPTTDEAKAGEQVFLNAACLMCHQVRGTQAGGRVAPDLTHLASRQMIGANSWPNNEGYLGAWVTHAQSMKPGCEMPDLTQFTGTQLQDLVAYLRQLN